MVEITVVDRLGDVRTISAKPGASLMEAIRASDFGDILATCGGCCSCASCHVFVDEAWTASLEEPATAEAELVEFSQFHRVTSRLSCQIKVTDQMKGLRVTIAPEE
jgi:2Fe-2S ferredoxin